MTECAGWLIGQINEKQTGQPWNVRVAALGALRALLRSVYLDQNTRAPALTPEDARRATQAAVAGLDDLKYSAVRKAALEAVVEMGERGVAFARLVDGVSWEAVVKSVNGLLKDRDPGVLRLAEKALKALEDTLEEVTGMDVDKPTDKSAGGGGDLYL
eukprot:CAMPEP_0197524588 /NCGR_PEP_ID=MMETSP1318-20131121/9216_1 /TAXON_ID=552666 /ORGANISM="Partenskyella glossopodia, Strain RCC365" /LENGTH=157 /DNA_ID=CAMNT_0043077569 /DNA_START=123 /DNA_END=599 /DNA_ORIENTATION=+